MTFKSIAAITLALIYSTAAFAQGGNDPIGGIDIIVKEDPSLAPVMSVSFDKNQLKKLNSLKGKDRPTYMAKIGAQYAEEAACGEQPKGGWDRVFQKALIDNWNPDERGGSTTLRTKAGNQAFKVTFKVKAAK